MKIARINVLIHLFKMLMSILCPLNLSVRFLWCVQFLSIKHRGVKQAAGRLVPLLQAWISPFWFSYLSWMGKGGGWGPGGGWEGAGGVVWKGFVRRSDAAIRGDSGGLCAFCTTRSDPSNTHKQQGVCEHSADMVFPRKRRIHTFKNKGRMGRGGARTNLKYPI